MMECKRLFLGSCLAVLASRLLCSNHYLCPEMVRIEINGDSRISCATEGKEIADAYWYKGSVSHTSPILQLEDGKLGGTEYGKGHFEIDNNGAMIITNVSLEHEGPYTFIVFFEDNTNESKYVTIYVTSTPNPPCPLIEGCFSCDECKLLVHNNGTIACELKEVRPKMTIEWTIESINGSYLTTYPPTFRKNLATDTWNVSVELTYAALSCEESILIRCVAQDDYSLLRNSSSSVQLQTDVCSHEGQSKAIIFVIFGSLTLGVLLVVAMIIRVCYRSKCRGYDRMHRKDRVKNSNQQEKETDEIDTAKRFKNALKNAYRRLCVLEPSPWGKAIPVVFAYADFQLKVQNNDGCSNISSGELLRDEKLKHEERLIIVGDTGCGKTSLTKALVQNWIDEEVNDSILIFISAEEMTEDLNIGSCLSKILPEDSKLNIRDIHSVLEISSIWLLIDGIDKLPIFLEEDVITIEIDKDIVPKTEQKGDKNKIHDGKNKGTDENSASVNDVEINKIPQQYLEEQQNSMQNTIVRATVKDFLKGNTSTVPRRVKVWVTSHQFQNMRTLFPLPYVEVQIDKFTETQLNSYIRKTWEYYFCFVSKRDTLPQLKDMLDKSNYSPEDDYEVTDSLLCEKDRKASTTEKRVQDKGIELKKHGEVIAPSVLKRVMEFVERNVFQDFSSTPSLLIMIVHILVAQNTSASNLPNVDIENIGTLISTVIKGLERRYLLRETPGRSKVDMNLLESTLEGLAFQVTIETTSLVVDSHVFLMKLDDALEAGIEIGLIQQRKGVTSNMEEKKSSPPSKKVEFCHKCIEEFFAASYIIKHLKNDDYRKTIKIMKERNKLGVLKFLSVLNKP